MTGPLPPRALAGRVPSRRLSDLAAALETVPFGCCLIGPDRGVIAINPVMAALLRRPDRTGTGLPHPLPHPLPLTLPLPLDQAAPALAALLEPWLDAALREQPAAEMPHLSLTEEEGGGTFRLGLSPLRDEAGAIEGLLCSAVDVSEERGAREALCLLFRSNPAPMWIYDRETLRFLEVNEAATRIYGWSREAFLGMSVLDIRPPAEQDRLRAFLASRQAVHEFTRNWRHIDAAGRERHVDVLSYATTYTGRPALLVTAWDVTERVLAEQALRESEAFARSVVESSMDCIKVLDLQGRMLFMNGPGRILMGIDDVHSLYGHSWTAALPAEMAHQAGLALEAARRGRIQRFTGHSPTGKGVPKWWDVVVSPIRGGDGRVVRLLAVSRDVTETRRAEQQIAYLAYHDPLTDLPNRRLFQKSLQGLFEQPAAGRLLAIHYLDLDHFKGVNDALGHTVGDALLRKMADRLRTVQREDRQVFRLGGDEFAVLQTGLREAGEATRLARRLVALLDEDAQIDGQLVAAGTSIGIALSPGHGDTPEALIKNADIALHHAKSGGRGTFRFFEPAMDEAVRRRQALKAGLRVALSRGELSLHFQPLVDLRTGAVSGLEALLRWMHPVHGAISPAEFIPLAEESGVVTRIGAWALRSACCAAACWPRPVPMAVNLSAVQFRDPGLVASVSEALDRSGLPADRLELEITESVLLQDEPANLASLNALRALGVRIALDDFGTGFSSLGYLLRIPFDKIKIDRSFIAGLPERPESNAIIRAVVSMGHSLGLTVTAEGVESEAQMAALRQLGCQDAQGFLFSRPVPAAQVGPLLERRFLPLGA